MLIMIDQANNAHELAASLRQIDTTVPRRVDGRNRPIRTTEVWSICHLLAALAKTKLLAYPFSLWHRERPDFQLQDGNVTIGVEVTEATTEQFAAYCSAVEKAGTGILEPAHFGVGAAKLSSAQFDSLLQETELTSDGWSGDSPEREWAQGIQSSVEKKLGTINHSTFQKFEKNWLAIYDNLPLPSIDVGKAVSYLRPRLDATWLCSPCFDVVFVETGSIIVRLTATSAEQLPFING
jgi:hypothetical protein